MTSLPTYGAAAAACGARDKVARRPVGERRDGSSKKKSESPSKSADAGASSDTSPSRVLRIPRAYGGAIVFDTRTNDVAGVDAYFAFVRAWFDARGNQLPLIDDGQEGIRELAAANAAATSAEWPSPPGQVTMRYEPVAPRHPKPNLPPPIAGDTYPTTPGLERRSVSTYVIAKAEERFATSTGLAVRHTEDGIVAEVEMRPPSGQLTNDALAEIRTVAAQLSAVDDDVLDVLLANAIANGADADDLHTIEIDAILDTRQRGVRHKADGGKTYLAGRRQETRDDAVERLRRLETLYVSIGERKMRGKLVREYDRVVGIQRLITDPNDDQRVLAVRYRFGKWFAAWRDGYALAPRRLLELDGRNRAPAKTLGRYFVQRARETDERGRIVRRVRDVLVDLRRPLHDTTGKNAGRPRANFEEHLETLEREGIFAAWGYIEANDSKNADAILGAGYKRAEAWLDLNLFVVLASGAIDPTG
jgi:hypothetical protein